MTADWASGYLQYSWHLVYDSPESGTHVSCLFCGQALDHTLATSTVKPHFSCKWDQKFPVNRVFHTSISVYLEEYHMHQMEVIKHAHNIDYISIVQLNILKLACTHSHRPPKRSSHSYTLNWFKQRLKMAWSSKSEAISWTLVGLGTFFRYATTFAELSAISLMFQATQL